MWTVKDCFEGPGCWCRIIVDPDGNECIEYASIWREDAAFLVDVLNQTPIEETNPPSHPLPWHVKTVDGGWKMIVTTEGLISDDLDHVVVYPQPDGRHLEMFVEAANSFYQPPCSKAAYR